MFVGAEEAKRTATAGGIPLDDISDDDEDPYDDEEEEDIDLEDFEEEDEEETMPKTPSKTPPRKKNRKAATPASAAGDDTGEELSARMTDQMNLAAPAFSMGYNMPFMHYVYNEGLDQMLKVEVFVPTFPKEYFVPDIVSGGLRLQIAIQVPAFFTDENRTLSSNQGEGFNSNTYQAQAYKDRCDSIITSLAANTNTVFGPPMTIDMPFVCEARIVQWEVQAYSTEIGTLNDDLGHEQHHAVLIVVLRKLRTKRKTAGGFRVVT